jgi:Domain of unknown function (DUF5658)
MSALRTYLAMRSPRLGPFGQRVLFWTIVELWVLNVVDLLLTRYSLWLGFASESNSVMRYLFHEGTWLAAVFKIGIVSVGALLLWRLRGYRSALLAAVVLAGFFAAVVVYQALWIASL